jgi:capsular polysaccharide biosynthesis protein
MDLKEYFKIIKKRLWLIILCVLVATSATGAYSYLFFKPVYSAYTKLIINKTTTQDQLGSEQMDLGAISVNIGLINTYREIIKTPAILDKVVQRYPDLGLTTARLNKILSVYAPNGTQVLTLQVVDYSYERASNIVNAVTEVVRTEIPRIMKFNNVEILNTADPDDVPMPLSQQTARKIVLSFLISTVIAVSLAFLLEFLDDTIKSKRDIQTVLGLPILSMIPAVKPKDLKPYKTQASRQRAGEASYAAIGK